jgi:hypothetical protein
MPPSFLFTMHRPLLVRRFDPDAANRMAGFRSSAPAPAWP